MKAYVFPGQGAQFSGMGKDLYEVYPEARGMFDKANELLGFPITDIMFTGTDEELRQTRVTQPAIFLHSVVLATVAGKTFAPAMVAGHSLGEFSALVAAGALSFEDGLRLVADRASAMQRACGINPSTMAAVLGMDDTVVEEVCSGLSGAVVPANYNSPGQIVISGTREGVALATEELKKRGAKRIVPLSVSGGFHSPCMEPARQELEEAIRQARFNKPVCPVYQNVTGLPVTEPDEIMANLIAQLTSPVRWTQTVQKMIADGATEFIEAGPGNVLQGLVKKINPGISVSPIDIVIP
ncbi:MAG TPA: [acyl-carrier-protein] S-malonyltransferase [Bacteroidales bacterium]|nr:[acyl-carrier-protein] S-malonyltransferase [Bacteroidales bacterium]